MLSKSKEKEEAVKLRRKGLTYSEILKEVPVAKSTLSLWLKEVGLSKPQVQRITKKRREAMLRGAQARRQQRIELTKRIYEEAYKDIEKITKRELWLIGIALYWAEGTKESDARRGGSVEFTNSDSVMIKFFLRWLVEILKLGKDRITFGIYIHKNSRNRIDKVKKFWSNCTGFPLESFQYVYYKKHNPKTKRRNTGDKYFGNLRVRVKASSDLCRRIAGWTERINNCRVV